MFHTESTEVTEGKSKLPPLDWRTPLPVLRISPLALLVMLAAVIACARLHTFYEPIGLDFADYAAIGHEMHFGKRLYTDLMDQKPPAIHLTYYAAETIAGYGYGEIYFLNVLVSVISLFAIYSACVSLLGNRSAALWAAAFWTVVSGNLRLEANQPNAEAFMNAFLLVGVALLARGYRRPTAGGGWGNAAQAGVCFAWATLYKQVIVFSPALLGLAYIVAPPPGKSRGRALGEMMLIGGMIIAAWGCTVGYFAWSRQFDAFFDSMVTYNRDYAGSMRANLLESLHLAWPDVMAGMLPLAGLTLVGMALGFVRKQWQPLLFLIALAVGTQIAVALPGKFFAHYYQLWFPFLIIGAGTAIAAIEAAALLPRLHTYTGIAILGLLLASEGPNYLLPAETWSEMKYGQMYLESSVLAQCINDLLKPEESFFQFGNRIELYPLTGRRPSCAILGVVGLYKGQLADRLRLRMIKELSESLPDLLVLTRRDAYIFRDDPRIIRLIETNFSLTKRGFVPNFYLMPRKGSALELRFGPPLKGTPWGN